ncbi:OLC1v1018618C1 [Oldenlandia corymbosa var. corymbosa]|uniref:OLC1v1018618C1 n=1 Tax=Oldenlandia corymbosa var. corymbosa TaxID=529605 RepID=A0AAV1EC56_OLDCO|nr:OLC1v1018618C1 [Oldenlandia corymbosa var. corymbosa]
MHYSDDVKTISSVETSLIQSNSSHDFDITDSEVVLVTSEILNDLTIDNTKDPDCVIGIDKTKITIIGTNENGDSDSLSNGNKVVNEPACACKMLVEADNITVIVNADEVDDSIGESGLK